MKETLKKYWFVSLIGVLLIGSICYFGYSKVASGDFDTLEGKSVNGEDVLFSIGEEDTTANAFYEELYNTMGAAGLYQFFERMVANSAIETTEEMQTEAKTNADNLIASYQSYYGDTYESTLLSALKGVGYTSIDDLDDYYLYVSKADKIIKDYVNANIDSVYEPYAEANKPRTVSHILIKFADVNNPTEEELAKLDEVKNALSNGMTFEEAASTYSDDSASAISSGSLGFMDANTQYVEAFLNAALALEEGQVSEWILSDYGYHLIRVDSTNKDVLMTYDDLYTSLLTYKPTLQTEAIWAKAQELNIEFANDDLKQSMLEYMGIGGNE